MVQTKATGLTLPQIAFEWARELEDQKAPGRRSEREIFRNLVSAVRQGEFGPGPFEVQRTPRAKWRRSVGPDGQDIYETNPPYLVSLDDLRKEVLPASGKGGIPWTERDVEDDGELYVRAFWESLSLPKQKIGQWCDEKGWKRPRFWFGDDSQVEPGRPRGSPAASSKRSVDPNLNRDSRKKGGLAPKYNVGLQKFIDQLFAEFERKDTRLTLSGLETWLVQHAQNDEGYDPEPPIPDCGDIEFYEDKIWWKDGNANLKSRTLRAVERYIARAKDHASGKAT